VPPGFAAWWRALGRRRQLVLVSIVVAALPAGAVAIAIMTRTTPPAPSYVVLDAVPWAMIKSVQDESGKFEALPADASTPLAVPLTPGVYRVMLEGPPPQAEVRTIELRVQSGTPASFPLQRFTPVDVDEYFRRYIPSSAPAIEAAPAGAGDEP
jgi:hypothetical protein